MEEVIIQIGIIITFIAFSFLKNKNGDVIIFGKSKKPKSTPEEAEQLVTKYISGRGVAEIYERRRRVWESKTENRIYQELKTYLNTTGIIVRNLEDYKEHRQELIEFIYERIREKGKKINKLVIRFILETYYREIDQQNPRVKKELNKKSVIGISIVVIFTILIIAFWVFLETNDYNL